MKTNLFKVFLIFSLSISITGMAQEAKSFSLEEAIQFAISNNYNLKNANTDVEIAKKKINETTAIGLPQIAGTISNTNYISLPTTLFPDFISEAIYGVNEEKFGLVPIVPLGETEFFPVSFGTKYNANAELKVQQLLFKGSYIVGLKAAKTYLEQAKFQLTKSEIDLRETVTNAYFLVLVAEEQMQILNATIKSLKELRDETYQVYQQGFIEDTEVDQLDLMLADLEASIFYAQNQIIISRAYLKLNLGLSLNNEIALTDDLEYLLEDIKDLNLLSSAFNIEGNIDYKILDNQKRLGELNLKNFQSEYLPSLSAFFNYTKSAQRNSFDFFDGSKPWYSTKVYGFTMDIPIFSSGMRKAKVQQAKLELKKIDELDEQLQSSLSIAYETATSNFRNNLSIHLNKNKSKSLSNKIYEKAQIKFKEGVYSSLELLQNYNQFLESESNYISSIVDLVSAKLALEKLFAE